MARPADPAFSPPFRLLAAALQPGRADADTLRSAWEQLDFALLLGLARRHRVMPGLAHTLAMAGLHPPPPYEGMIGPTLSQAAFHELALAGATRRLVEALDKAGARAVVLKGVALSSRLHGRLGLRTSRDIDLLVQPSAVAAALDVLDGLGFRPAQPLDRRTLPALMRRRKDIELLGKDGSQIVELHWRLFDNPHLMPLPDGPPARSATLSGELSCLVLEDSFNLLYLANHGAQHGWSRLKWLADFAGLAHALGPDAVAALYDATPYAAGRRALGQALLLSAELMGLETPRQLLEEAPRDRRLRTLLALARHILAGSGATEIEDLRFGSTRKNLSHYLISSAPTYLLAEAWFDLTQFPESDGPPGLRSLGPAGRLLSWANRHLRPC
jgi:hypothetical protein